MRALPTPTKKGIYLAVIAIAVWVLANPAFPNTGSNERVINLKGTTNTRDIGGYQTSDLGTVRFGQIIRSDKLSKLTTKDFQKLEEMGLKTVIDLRTNQEHERSPTVWQGDSPPRFFHLPVGDANGYWFKGQKKMMKKNRFTEEQSLEHMVDGYSIFAEKGRPSYQKLMEIVLDESNWPILIHCNAGKDRSGIAVALILEALDVDRETIMEEYLLTNEISRIEDKAAFLARQSKSLSRADRYSKGVPASAWLPIVGVRAEMLENFYASVDEKYGSVDAFLNELGVDQDARGELVASLTMKPPQMVMSE